MKNTLTAREANRISRYSTRARFTPPPDRLSLLRPKRRWSWRLFEHGTARSAGCDPPGEAEGCEVPFQLGAAVLVGQPGRLAGGVLAQQDALQPVGVVVPDVFGDQPVV